VADEDPAGTSERPVFEPAETAGPTWSAPAAVDASLPVAPSDSLSPSERVIPSWTDATVRRASDLIGGPLGVHAQVGRNKIITPLRVCLAMAIGVLILGWLYKSACIQQAPNGSGGFVLDQSGQRPWITACYNDVVPLYGSHHLDTQQLPYKTSWIDNGQTHYMEYPVVTGYWMWAVSWLTKGYLAVVKAVGLPVSLDVAAYFTIGAILLGLLYLVAVACTARMTRRRIWDTAIMCLSPLLIVHAFTNWDLLAIALAAAAMLAWSRSTVRADGTIPLAMPILAGVLIGVGTAAKLYPALLLGPLLLLALRSGRFAGWVSATGAALVTWLVINVPVMLLWPAGWQEFFKLNTQRPAEYDSWYAIFTSLSGSTVFDTPAGSDSPGFLNALSFVLFGVACVAIAWFTLSVRRRPRFAQLVFLAVAAFLLTNKVWSPQYSLWLVPLAVLAIPRWRLLLAWQFAEWACWLLLMLSFDSDTGKNLPIYPFDVVALIRDALLIAIVVKLIREMIRPERDLIRMAGDDDPTGGMFENAPDRLRLPSLPELWKRRAPLAEAVENEVQEPVQVAGDS
jgi:uncharacterized membrane protein